MRTRQQGFTLIEIMVVVLLIGLVLAAVSLAVGGKSEQEQARVAAEELVLEANYLIEQAVLKGETYGLFVALQAPALERKSASAVWCYQWQRVRDHHWDPLPELPEAKCLDEGLVLEVSVDGRKWKYDPKLEYQDPVLGFFPSGDASGDIEMAIFAQNSATTDDRQVQHIAINPLGELHWRNQEALAQGEARAR